MTQSVQGRRDPIIPKSEDLEPLSACSPSKYSTEREALSACASTLNLGAYHSNVSVASETKLLTMISENYRTFRLVRRSTELAMHGGNSMRSILTDNKNSEMFLVTYETGSKAVRAQWPIVLNFMRETFQEMNDLSAKDRFSLLSHARLVFQTLDTDYITTEKIPFEELHIKTMVSETLYADIGDGRMGNFLSGSPIDLPTEQFCTLMGPYGLIKFKHARILAEMKLDKIEYYALLTLTLWSETMFGSNDDIVEAAKSIRKRIHEELHSWYTCSGNPNYAERMGSLLFQVNSALARVDKQREMVELMNILVIPNKEDLLLDLLRHNIDCETARIL